MKKRESKSPSRSTKRALTSSVLALVLCFVMLLGTTFAWFTDTASTKVNTIQAGKLDVALVDEAGKSLEGKTLAWQKAEGHENEEVLWEPGATYSLQDVTVKNNGNLALKYQIVIAGVEGDAKLNEAINWTITVTKADTTTTTYTTDEWISLGVDKSDTLTISGTMDKKAGNEYQGLSIENVAITVVATQDTVEYDSNDNQYDKDAVKVYEWSHTFATDNLKSAVVDSTTVIKGKYVENGYTANGHKAILLNQKTNEAATFEDCIFLCDVGGVDSKEAGSLTFTDCTFYGWVHFGNPSGANIKFENCTFTSTCDVKVGGSANSVTFDNCTFEAKDTIVDSATMNANYTYAGECGRVMIWSNTTFNNCTILREVYEGVENAATYTDCAAPTLVSTAADLKTALAKGGTIVLTADINMNNAWTTAALENKNLTLDGNGHTITKLNAPLINFYGGTCTVNNLTVANSTVVANGGDSDDVLGTGVILEQAQWCNLYMNNCHVKNCSVNVGGENSRAGGLVGYWIGGGEIKNCSVSGTTVYGVESAGGIVGHNQAQSGYESTSKVTNCTASNNSVTSNEYAGQVLGRMSVGTFEISNCTYTGDAYGNIWNGGDCKVIINGTTYTANSETNS